jgi:hypoxanthine phosphoribosyltransferase
VGRPATAVKQRLRTDIILGRLPQRVAYLLRWLEVAARERMLRKDSPANETHAEVASSDAEGALASARRVLVVDDTIDSGRTLQAAVRTVRKHNPDCEVRTAALASTWRNPPVSPEYLLHPRTLVRFHWSLDVRT